MPNQQSLHNAQSFIKIFNQLTYRFLSWEVWKDFIAMFACAISNSVDKSHYDEREALYLKTIQKYNFNERKLFPQLAAETVMALEENSEQDFLGELFMRLNLGSKAREQFFTPYDVCRCMAKMAVGNVMPIIQEHGYITISDPCCGAGATLIAGIHEVKNRLDGKLNYQNHLLVIGQDIDYTAALMCYIQLSLLGTAGYIKIGNTLTEPMSLNDTPKNYWFTPMYFSDVWSIRRILKGQTFL